MGIASALLGGCFEHQRPVGQPAPSTDLGWLTFLPATRTFAFMSLFNGGAGIEGRCYNFGPPPSTTGSYTGSGEFIYPPAGGDIDGVFYGGMWRPALPGSVVRVEAAAAFASGVTLATDADGRLRPALAGEHGVLRALQASASAGSYVTAVLTHGGKT